jgi:hypothetical protein
MVPRVLRVVALSSLLLAGTAAAAGSPVTATLTPNTASSPSGAAITVNGPFPAGLPSSLSLQMQPGFRSSIKSVSTLCTAAAGAAGTCPSASQIGSGTIDVGVPIIGAATVPLKLWLGAPSQPTDIATVYMYGTLDGISLPAAARLFVPSGGGLELLIAKFPSLSGALALVKPTITSISLTAKAIRTVTVKVSPTKKKHKGRKHHKKARRTYSLLTNPPTCTGAWTGTMSATFSAGPVQRPFSAPCTK